MSKLSDNTAVTHEVGEGAPTLTVAVESGPDNEHRAAVEAGAPPMSAETPSRTDLHSVTHALVSDHAPIRFKVTVGGTSPKLRVRLRVPERG